MLDIWREQIERLQVIDTGALHQSLQGSLNESAQGLDIYMKFYQYGIYQALGTGNGYKHDNGGDLYFLGEERGNRPYEPRKKRNWYSKKLFMSVMAFKEDMARLTGTEAVHLLKESMAGR